MATIETDIVLKSAYDWLKEPIIQDNPGMTVEIWNADGWHHNDGVSMNTPITLEDFQARLNECTLHTFPSGEPDAE